MRIAHIIMAHKNPEQLLRLIQRLQHQNADFYIHVDMKSNIAEFKDILSKVPVTYIENRTKCTWGGHKFLTAVVRSVQEILNLNKGYNFINLLSAQDYPLMPADKMHDYLEKNPDRNYISYEPDGSFWWTHAAARYEKYHFTDLNFTGKYFLEKIANIVLPKRKFPLPVKLYGGSKSSWWTITSDCADYICNQLTNDKKLNDFLKLCWGTDEFVLPTLIMNSKFSSTTVADNRRYIDWSEGNAHPKLLSVVDFENIKQSGMLFARKFESDDEVLNKIDKELLGLQ